MKRYIRASKVSIEQMMNIEDSCAAVLQEAVDQSEFRGSEVKKVRIDYDGRFYTLEFKLSSPTVQVSNFPAYIFIGRKLYVPSVSEMLDGLEKMHSHYWIILESEVAELKHEIKDAQKSASRAVKEVLSEFECKGDLWPFDEYPTDYAKDSWPVEIVFKYIPGIELQNKEGSYGNVAILPSNGRQYHFTLEDQGKTVYWKKSESYQSNKKAIDNAVEFTLNELYDSVN